MKPVGTQQYQKVFTVKAMDGGSVDMAMIQRFAPEMLDPEMIYARKEWLANDQVDRSFERFTTDTLQQFVMTIPGKAKLIGHDYKAAPLGRYFDASIEQDPATGWNWLAPKFYMVKTADNEHARAQIDGGVWSYVSIGFSCEKLVCDLCGESFYSWDCPHWPGEEYADAPAAGPQHSGMKSVCTLHYEGQAEAVEGSIVYLGCQHDARIVKAAGDIELAHAGKLAGLKQKRTAANVPFEAGDLFPATSKAVELPEPWEDFATFVCKFYGGRGGMECDRAETWKAIAARYEAEGKAAPLYRWAGTESPKQPWDASIPFSAVEFQNGEKEIFETTKFSGDCESARNISRHFVKEGRVLSAQNLALVQECIDSLTALRDAGTVAPMSIPDEPGDQSAVSMSARDVIAGVVEMLRKEREQSALATLKRINESWKK